MSHIIDFHHCFWLWDKNETRAHHRHLIVRRELNSKKTCKYTLPNASEETSTQQFAQMQGQRY